MEGGPGADGEARQKRLHSASATVNIDLYRGGLAVRGSAGQDVQGRGAGKEPGRLGTRVRDSSQRRAGGSRPVPTGCEAPRAGTALGSPPTVWPAQYLEAGEGVTFLRRDERTAPDPRARPRSGRCAAPPPPPPPRSRAAPAGRGEEELGAKGRQRGGGRWAGGGSFAPTVSGEASCDRPPLVRSAGAGEAAAGRGGPGRGVSPGAAPGRLPLRSPPVPRPGSRVHLAVGEQRRPPRAGLSSGAAAPPAGRSALAVQRRRPGWREAGGAAVSRAERTHAPALPESSPSCLAAAPGAALRRVEAAPGAPRPGPGFPSPSPPKAGRAL